MAKTAQRTSSCPLCPTKIIKGEQIVSIEGGKRWVHEACARAAGITPDGVPAAVGAFEKPDWWER